MLRHWLRTRQQLHDLLDDADADNAELAVDLDDLAEKNLALTRQLDATRAELNATVAERDDLRADLVEARRGDPLHKELQQANTQVTVLEQALNRMQQSSFALDQPFS